MTGRDIFYCHIVLLLDQIWFLLASNTSFSSSVEFFYFKLTSCWRATICFLCRTPSAGLQTSSAGVEQDPAPPHPSSPQPHPSGHLPGLIRKTPDGRHGDALWLKIKHRNKETVGTDGDPGRNYNNQLCVLTDEEDFSESGHKRRRGVSGFDHFLWCQQPRVSSNRSNLLFPLWTKTTDASSGHFDTSGASFPSSTAVELISTWSWCLYFPRRSLETRQQTVFFQESKALIDGRQRSRDRALFTEDSQRTRDKSLHVLCCCLFA